MKPILPLLQLLLIANLAGAAEPSTRPTFGLTGAVGHLDNPKRVDALTIDKPGVYENYLIDTNFAARDAVRIKADNVVLRNCEIRNGRQDAIEVYAADVLIENCKIHHFLAGSFKDQKDAHGITGRPMRLTIRNCDIGYVSGDCLQFDPGRGPWDQVLVENCRLFTAPLPQDAAGFKKGEQPGENGLDTKQSAKNPRSRLTLRHCIVAGFAKNGQISNMAALNIKNHVDVRVENCLFIDNEIALRLRGPGKADNAYGGAHATIADCYIYRTDVAFRIEDNLKDLAILRPRIDKTVRREFHFVGSAAMTPTDPQPAPKIDTLAPASK